MMIPFVGPSYEQAALSFDCQRSINQYLMLSEVPTSKTPSSMRGTPGLKTFVDVGAGLIRGGATASNGRGFFVSINKLYELNSNGTATERGTLLTNDTNISFSQNNVGQLMLVDGTYGYIFNMSTNVYAQITDPDFPSTDIVTFLDGYFIVSKKDTQEYHISGINNGLTWGPLDYGTASVSPDNLTAAFASNSNLYLLGKTSIEIHQNTGAAAFPFERISGAVVQTGCAAAFTVQEFDNTIAFLGFDKQGRGLVLKMNQYNAERISTQAIERRIAEAEDITDAKAWVYHEEGHVFYCLMIAGLDTTLVYDGTTGQWHERAFYNSSTGSYEQHLGGCCFFFDQRLMVGDRQTGRVYHMNLDFYDDAGDEIVRDRTCTHLQEEKRLIQYSTIELDMEVGVGAVNGQGSAPQMMMQYSDDGGRTWSAEIWRTIGAIGKFRNRVNWRKCGSGRDRVFRFKYSEPTQYQVNGAYVNAT